MTLFLDACIVIYWIEARDPFHSRLLARLRVLGSRSPQATFAVSRLSWLECMIGPLRESDEVLAGEYRAFFESAQLHVVELTAAVVERATLLRARFGLKTPDALQAASAFEAGTDVLFLTNDTRLRRVPDLQIEVLK